MRIGIIGSSQYRDRMEAHRAFMLLSGHFALMPVLDDITAEMPEAEFEINSRNRHMIEWADEVHLFWNQRTLGTLVDLGMAFALRKPIKVMYLEQKTLANFILQYERKGPNE